MATNERQRDVLPAAAGTPERARYRVTETSYIADALREEGTVIHYDGVPGYNLEPLNEAAHEAVAKGPGVDQVGPQHPDFVRNMIQRVLNEGGASKAPAKA